MATNIPHTHGLQSVLARFPAEAAEIRFLALRDQTFRAICDDLALALGELARFEARPDAVDCVEILEYRTIIFELDAEIIGYLSARRGK